MKRTQNLLLTLLVFSTASFAQKLPTVQKNSLYAPANIKVDGNATEWGNKFQAYNKATNVFYTISNDKENLYLVIQATEDNIIYKIINGGITFSINNTGKEKDNGIKITYPLFGMGNLPMINLKDKPLTGNNTSNYTARIDSFKNALNGQLEKNEKEIKVLGIKIITDSLISVYNDQGIRAAEHFDGQLAYTYELAIPIKYLKGANINLAQIHYNVKINGRLTSLTAGKKEVVLIVAKPSSMDALYNTDFWGEYALAEKP